MDVLDLISKQIEQFSGHEIHKYLQSIHSHLRIAERHYSDANQTGDSTLFNDVIYRCNQAFEGILRETYGLYSGIDKSKPQTLEIEKYLEKNNILRLRVVELLRNYRQQWRNPATHNYWLTFDSSESLVAILTIEAFAAVLLEQITHKFFYEVQRTESSPTQLSDASTEDPIELFAGAYELLAPTAESYEGDIGGVEKAVGEFVGVLAAVAPHISFRLDYVFGIGGKKVAEFDLLIERERQQIPVEFKLAPRSKTTSTRSTEDRFILEILKAGLDIGILCFIPRERVESTHHVVKQVRVDDRTVVLHVLFPANSFLERSYLQ